MSKAGDSKYFALFNAMVQNNNNESITSIIRDLYAVHWFISANSQIKHHLENIILPVAARKKIMLTVIEEVTSNSSEYTIAFLFYLLENNFFSKLSYIMHIFKYYFANETDLLLVEVISRYEVPEDILEFYKNKIEEQSKHNVQFIFKKVPNMLGGFKLRWHTGEIDATLRKQVDQLKDLIVHG